MTCKLRFADCGLRFIYSKFQTYCWFQFQLFVYFIYKCIWCFFINVITNFIILFFIHHHWFFIQCILRRTPTWLPQPHQGGRKLGLDSWNRNKPNACLFYICVLLAFKHSYGKNWHQYSNRIPAAGRNDCRYRPWNHQ